MFPLLRTRELGKLELYEVYDYFDGPKFFSVKNNFGELYLVYWSGDYQSEESTKWLYLRVSENRLNQVRKSLLSVFEAFRTPERDLFCVLQSFDGRRVVVHDAAGQSINFPPEDFEFDIEDIEVVHPEADWLFELGIYKRASTPNTTLVSRVIDVVTSILEELIEIGGRAEPKLYPLTAAYGSFKVKVGSNCTAETEVALGKLSKILNPESEDMDIISRYRIDPYRIQELLELVSTNKIELRFSSKSSDALVDEISIDSSVSDALIERVVSSSSVFVDSIKVPQANDLDRVITVVCRKAEGLSLDHEHIEGISSKRQVRYYTDAAFTLGLLERNTAITSAGLFLASLETQIQRYKFLADRFESSDVGWAWIRWANVSSLNQLDPATASVFIRECVKGLNDETSDRRGTTLFRWWQILSPHCRGYRLNGDSS